MKLRYIGKTIKKGGYPVKDGFTFTKKGEVLDIPVTEEELNPWVLQGVDPVLEIVGEEVIEIKEVEVIKRRGFNKR